MQRDEKKMIIIVVSARENNESYSEAHKRIMGISIEEQDFRCVQARWLSANLKYAGTKKIIKTANMEHMFVL